VVDFDAVSFDQLRTLAYGARPIPGSADGTNQLVRGDVFAVRTGAGNYAKVQVVEYGYNLTLRWVTYAPTPQGPPPPPPPLVSSGQGVLRGTWLFDFDAGVESGSAGADVWWEQMTEVARQMVPQGVAQIVNLGVVDFDAVSFDQLRTLAYGARPIPGSADGTNQLVRGDVFAVRTGAGNYAKVQVVEYGYNLTLRWMTYPEAGQPPGGRPVTYLVIGYSDELRPAPDPFVFPRGSSVFVGIGDVGQGFGLQRHDLPFRGRVHSYYRDLAQPWVFYYLPDELRLARRAASPHVPAMTAQMNATPDTLEASTVALAYLAMPHAGMDRLEAARTALAPLLPASLPTGVTGPMLQALQVDSSTVRFTLSLPRQDGSTAATVRDQAIIDLRSGIADSVTMPLADFRPVYQALFSNTDLFRGDVAIQLGGGVNTEHVSLIGRIAKMTGAPVLDGAQQPSGDDVSVTLTNAIESPVRVASLAARLARGTSMFPGTIQGLTATLPAELGPEEAIGFVVKPTNPPIPGSGPLDAVMDLDGITVLPAADKVWQAILSPLASNQYTHEITLEVFAAAFAAPPDKPDDHVIELNIDFREGDTVQVTPAQLPPGPTGPGSKVRLTVTLRMPVVDWLLNKPQFNDYTYRIHVVRPSGEVTGPWTPRQGDILPILTVPGPAS
jgi:hypothetical protein